jgi:2-oxoglutarate/2-oxoacid ferredoxin oxidoreductase subunit alpha
MATALQDLPPQDNAAPDPENIVVRFAGDSGDGMQLTGGQFMLSSALAGNDFSTFPDFRVDVD